MSKVVWFEVCGKDANGLRGFYGELFGWKFQVGFMAAMRARGAAP